MLSGRQRFLSQRSWIVGVMAGLVVSVGCVRKSNPDGKGDHCSLATDCGPGAECVEQVCVLVPSSRGRGNTAGGAPASSTGGATSFPGNGGAMSDTTGGVNDTGGHDGETGGTARGGASATGGGAPGGSSATGGSSSSGSGGSSAGQGAGGQAATGGSSGEESSLVDDLEDGDDRIITTEGRQGPWHTFTPNGSGALMPEKGGAHDSMYAVHTSGGGLDYAGMGFDLNNGEAAPESMQSKAYDASAYAGISFMIKSGPSNTVRLRLEIPTRALVPSDRGGNCSDDCWNVYGWEMPMPRPTTTWQEVKVPFSSLVRQNGAKSPAFDRSQLMSVSFKQIEKANFDFWIDEVRFYK